MTHTEQNIIDALTAYYGMELPFTHSKYGAAWDVCMDDTTIRFWVDDDEANCVKVIVFSGGQAMLIAADATFTNMPPVVIAQTIAHHLDAAFANA